MYEYEYRGAESRRTKVRDGVKDTKFKNQRIEKRPWANENEKEFVEDFRMGRKEDCEKGRKGKT